MLYTGRTNTFDTFTNLSGFSQHHHRVNVLGHDHPLPRLYPALPEFDARTRCENGTSGTVIPEMDHMLFPLNVCSSI